MSSQDSVEWHNRMLRAWQLALLRFAVTLENVDRLNVMAIANEIDRGGRPHDERASFAYFRKTSTELCTSILRQNETADATLRQFLARIEDARIKRVFASAIEIHPAPAVRKPKDRSALWRGLASRIDRLPASVPARAR
jgi:hypothetical protein